VRAIIVPTKSLEADPTILDGWSANLPLLDYGRFARDPDTISKVIGRTTPTVVRLPRQGLFATRPDGEPNLTPKGTGA